MTSDVYMLILGGRYGSIEPKSQKSYIQLEYEYAVEKGKPFFAVVIDENHLEEKTKQYGSNVFEKDHPDKLKEFRTQVVSKMVRFWKNPLEIKLAILETMSEFGRREDLVGWISGNETIDSGVVAEELARLAKENAALREQIANSPNSKIYNGLSFEEMFELLSSYEIELLGLSEPYRIAVDKFRQVFNIDSKATYLHLYWVLSGVLRDASIVTIRTSSEEQRLLGKLIDFGLVFREKQARSGESPYSMSFERFKTTDSGKQFLIRLRIDKGFIQYEGFIFEVKSDQ